MALLLQKYNRKFKTYAMCAAKTVTSRQQPVRPSASRLTQSQCKSHVPTHIQTSKEIPERSKPKNSPYMSSKSIHSICTAEPTTLKNKFSTLEIMAATTPIPAPRKRTSLRKKVTIVKTDQKKKFETVDKIAAYIENPTSKHHSDFNTRNFENRLPPSHVDLASQTEQSDLGANTTSRELHLTIGEATDIRAAQIPTSETTLRFDKDVKYTTAKQVDTQTTILDGRTKENSVPSGGEQTDTAANNYAGDDQSKTGPSGGEQLISFGTNPAEKELGTTGPSGGEQTGTSVYTRENNVNGELKGSEPSGGEHASTSRIISKEAQAEKIKTCHSSNIQGNEYKKIYTFTTGSDQEIYRTRSAGDFRALVIVKIVLGIIGSSILKKILDAVSGSKQE